MNIVFLSPHFPPNFYPFCVHLRRLGANVLGIADQSYEHLRPELRQALTEYYRVDDLHNYDQLVRAFGYFTHRYGKLNRLDSHNEYWLETEARLRDDFNIPGLRTSQMDRIKRKSQMKRVYQQAGVPVARGGIAHTMQDAQSLIEQTGYHLVAKPDVGVGAARTYKIHNQAELRAFFAEKPDVDYFLEEFIQGQIVSFDGLADYDGNLVFYTAHTYSHGVMETVNRGGDLYYYSHRQIPTDLERTGRKVARAFDASGRFFHFEFFRTQDGGLVALEVNMRPPGGLTTDMFNFANDIDVYAAWATLMVTGSVELPEERPYHVLYAGRKSFRQYAHTHDEVLAKCGDLLVHHQPIDGVFAPAIGDYGFVLRSPELPNLVELAGYIQQVA
jgi:biotin carboxylase